MAGADGLRRQAGTEYAAGPIDRSAERVVERERPVVGTRAAAAGLDAAAAVGRGGRPGFDLAAIRDGPGRGNDIRPGTVPAGRA